MSSVEYRQLTFAFADSPQGGGPAERTDASASTAGLLHKTKVKEASYATAWMADTSRLLEEVATASNLALALQNVARNKGAAGADGRSIREVVEAAPQLLPKLQRELLAGSYQPGDIRRVWIAKFFDRVHQQRLLNRMAQRLADGRILKLVHRLLKAKVVLPEGVRIDTVAGVPQGGPLSPLLSNIVLDELDWELARRGHRFVRYADDFSVFVTSERAGRRVMESVRKFIEGRLRLVVNEDKSSVSQPNELTFLGFQLGQNPEGEITVTISARTKHRMDTRLRELTPRTWGQAVSKCLARLNSYLRGWFGYFRLCTREGLRSFGTFDAHIRRRLRALILRQKKRPRHLFRFLLLRGVSRGSAAKTAFARSGIWRRSISHGIHKAFPNDWFAERLVSLHAVWERLHPVEQVLYKQGTLFD